MTKFGWVRKIRKYAIFFRRVAYISRLKKLLLYPWDINGPILKYSPHSTTANFWYHLEIGIPDSPVASIFSLSHVWTPQGRFEDSRIRKWQGTWTNGAFFAPERTRNTFLLFKLINCIKKWQWENYLLYWLLMLDRIRQQCFLMEIRSQRNTIRFHEVCEFMNPNDASGLSCRSSVPFLCNNNYKKKVKFTYW